MPGAAPGRQGGDRATIRHPGVELTILDGGGRRLPARQTLSVSASACTVGCVSSSKRVTSDTASVTGL